MISFRLILFAAAILAATAVNAFAEKRVALVIGNSAYENVGRLGNPANDAAAMTATLQQAGFDVVESQPTMHGSRPNKMRRTTRPRITA